MTSTIEGGIDSVQERRALPGHRNCGADDFDSPSTCATGRVILSPKGVRLPAGRGGRPNTLHISHVDNISERPPEAEDRPAPGHWEGDLVFGMAMSALTTLVERSTRYLMLVALSVGNHQADAVADALAAAITTLPDQLAKSLT